MGSSRGQSPLDEKVDIAEVARRSGVPASTLRFYEEKGLIESVGRRGLRRLFDGSVLDRLALIALGRVAGFSLEEIAGMFAPDGRLRIKRERLTAKADELDRTIQRLAALRDGLRHAAACAAPSHMECPRFRSIVRLASSGRLDGEKTRSPRKRQRQVVATRSSSQLRGGRKPSVLPPK